MQPFADPRVGAVSGNAKVVNRGGLLGRWQHIEYVVGFNLDRRLFDLTVHADRARRGRRASAAGRCSPSAASVTSPSPRTPTSPWHCAGPAGAWCTEHAVAWTEAPASLNALWRQRYRWCYGTLQAMWKHRGALIQRGAAGKLGRRGLVYLLLFQVLLPLLAPVVDVFAVYGLVFLNPPADHRPVAGLASSCNSAWACTRSAWTASGPARCGACRCSSWSTAS